MKGLHTFLAVSLVTFLGPEGTFSHEFARKAFPDSEWVPVDGELEDVLPSACERGAEFATLPFLNSSGLQVVPAQQSVARYIGSYWVTGAQALKVVHHLVGTDQFEELKTIRTKEQVFPQCKKWLAKHGQGITRLHAASTSAALIDLHQAPKSEQRTTAVICNDLAIELYSGRVIERAIEDDGNQTLFWKLSRMRPGYSERILVCLNCPGVDCYNSSVDLFVREGCLLKFSTLVGTFSPQVPMFLEFEVPSWVNAEELIEKTCLESDGIRKFAGSYPEADSISRCVVDLFEPHYDEDSL